MVCSIICFVLVVAALVAFLLYKFANIKLNKVTYYCATIAGICAIPASVLILTCVILCFAFASEGSGASVCAGAYMFLVAVWVSNIFALKCVTKPRSTVDLK